MTLRERLTEYLTLKEALAAAGRVAEAERAEATRELRLSRQKRLAAEQLLVDGSRSEAARLAAESAKLVAAAVDRLGETRSDRLARAAAEVAARAKDLGEAPALDGDVTAARVAATRKALVAGYEIERLLELALLDRPGLLRLRVIHWGRVVACAVFVFFAAAFVHAILFGPRAQASSEQSALFGAERAVDGDPETEWAPKEHDHQWLELSWRTSRRVRTIKLLNGHGQIGHASENVHVELFRDARLLRSVDGSFGNTPAKVFLLLDGGNVRCNRMRIFPSAPPGRDPAIAEVIVE
jgi:hypothetical protein